MQYAKADIRHLARMAAALCALMLASAISILPLASSPAHADEVASASASGIRSLGAQVDVGFFIAVVDDGAASYPQNEEELQQILTGVYSPGIYIDVAFDASDFAEFGGGLYDQELYDLSGVSINERILIFPTEDQIAAACAQGGIDFDPETQTVVWYVVKSAQSTWDTVWHIDGLLVSKAIAPDPDEPAGPDDPDEPVDPDPDPDVPIDPEPGPDSDPDAPVEPDPDDPGAPVDPDPDDPTDPDPDPDAPVDPNPDAPGQDDPSSPDDPNDSNKDPVPSDPDDPSAEDPDSTVVPGDGEHVSDGNPDGPPSGTVQNAPHEQGGEAAEHASSQTIIPLSTAPLASDAPAPAASEPLAPENEAETEDEALATEVIEDADTPLQALSGISESAFSQGVAAPQSSLSEPASTALHVAGAVGLIGVAVGAVALNVTMAQAGSALSSLDSRLRDRGRGRRR